MRSSDAVTIEADDPVAPGELKALADQQGWAMTMMDDRHFLLERQG